MTDVQIVNAEALVVGPDEVLIVTLPEQHFEIAEQIAEHMKLVGLEGRFLVLVGEIELAKQAR